MKKFIMINHGFSCENCGYEITPHPTGSARNHCPKCLYSKHLDKNSPGDRKSDCKALMKPIGVDYKKNKGNMIRHSCLSCKKKILNQIAPDDDFLSFIKELQRY